MKTEYAQAFLVLSISDLIFFVCPFKLYGFLVLAYVAALGESLFWKREFSKQLRQLSISINWFPNIILGGYLLLS